MKVSLLKFKTRNPRKISPDQLDKLKESITKFPKAGIKPFCDYPAVKDYQRTLYH